MLCFPKNSNKEARTNRRNVLWQCISDMSPRELLIFDGKQPIKPNVAKTKMVPRSRRRKQYILNDKARDLNYGICISSEKARERFTQDLQRIIKIGWPSQGRARPTTMSSPRVAVSYISATIYTTKYDNIAKIANPFEMRLITSTKSLLIRTFVDIIVDML